MIRHPLPVIFALVVIHSFVTSAPAQSSQNSFAQQCADIARQTGGDAQRLHRLFDVQWEHTMREDPEFATEVGYAGQNDRWSDQSLEAIAQRKEESKLLLAAVNSIVRGGLTAADQLNYDLFKRRIELEIEGQRFKREYMPITQVSGVQQEAAEILEVSPRATVKDYENLLARLQALPALIDQTIVLMRKGIEAGVSPPQITLRDVPDQIRSQANTDLEKNALLKPFTEFPFGMADADRQRLRAEAQAALKEKVAPAFGRLYDYFTSSYLPLARQSIAMSDLPDGKAWYAHNVRLQTTTSLTPQQIHDIGLAEVKRIRGEMDAVIAQSGFKGDFSQFCNFLRTDPRFFYTNADDLLRGYRDIAKRTDPALARLFGKLPRLPYGVLPVPAYSEKSQTAAYYQPGSPKAGRAGYFFANTYALDMRPKWEMEALTFHEAVPGHHLQIALAQEMEGAPEFRKHGMYTAYVEGWGLYAESLGSEMGFYEDPYLKFGQLTYEIWRAIRLVVDTGIHSMGWTRQRAIDYFMANSSKTEHDVTVEVDRYIVWPGQALAYKIGEMKIKELRAYARQQLGPRFDVRQFHDQVLDNGALPLDVLESTIKEWVERAKNAP